MGSRLCLLSVLCLICPAFLGGVSQQSAGQEPTARVSGSVVERPSGTPVAGANIEITSTSGLNFKATSGSNGRYTVDLPAGTYSVRVKKQGFLDGGYGLYELSDSPRLVALNSGETLGNGDVSLCRPTSISGIVRDDAGEPLVGVRVHLLRLGESRSYSTEAEQKTDDRGNYRFGGLPPGSYLPVVRSALTTYPPDMLEYGDVWSRTSVGGKHVQHSNALPLAISPQGSTVASVYPTTYFGNTTTPSNATLVVLDCGESRLSADFGLNWVSAGSITGTIVGPAGPLGLAFVRLVSVGAEEMPTTLGFETAITVSAGDGSFSFLGVPSGSYTVRVLHIQSTSNPLLNLDIAAALLASPVERQVERELTAKLSPPPAAPTLFGSHSIVVGERPVPGVQVLLSEAARVGGVVVFDGDGPKPALVDVRLGIGLVRADGRVSDVMKAGWVTRAGTFSTFGSPPGRYYVRVLGGIPGWSVESVRLGDQDLLDLPVELGAEHVAGVEVRLVRAQATVSGTVNVSGKPDTQATVLVFPEDRRFWRVPEVAASRFKAVRATTKGAFRIDQLRSGTYLVAAVPDSRVAGWMKEEQLNSLAASAVPIRIQTGIGHNLNLNTTLKR